MSIQKIFMNILWYYRRLRTMSLKEILWRLRRFLWQLSALLLRKRSQLRYENIHGDQLETIKTIKAVNFYGLSDISSKDIPQKWVDNTINIAEKLLMHRYNYFNLGEIYLGKKIKWNHEYKRNIDTPLLFAPWINHRENNIYGDFKYSWELPRLQHLITLAKAYYLKGDKKYAQEVISQINSFVKQSPYLLGINWLMPMEASIRLISICWITAFLKKYFKDNSEELKVIESIVNSHVDYISKNYAAHSSGNNHLVAEATGVFMASVLFNHYDKMEKHRQKSHDILCKEIHHQYYEDGVNKEQTSHYQVFTHNCFLLAGLLGKFNNITFPPCYWQMLEKSANFIASIADDDCSIPSLGDSDGGKAITLSETDTNPVKSILTISAVLFERQDIKEKVEYFDETSLWLLGNNGKNTFDSLATTFFSPEKEFKNGGYYILNHNNSNMKIIFDCGALGFGTIAAHGHADALSFILNVHNIQYFADPGTYTYVSNDPYRNYFRSTKAHNTLVVDGHNQSEIGGSFLWNYKANSFVDEWITNEQYDRVTAWHDGYCRLQDPVTHKRSIELNKEQEIITVDDYLVMKKKHKIEQFFHLAPKCDVEKTGNNSWRIINSNKIIEFYLDEKLNCELYRANQNPICGYFSNAYDQICPTNTFKCSGEFVGNQHFTTKIKIRK